MNEEDTRRAEDEAKRNNALMQALIRVAALEKTLLKKGVFTDVELAEGLASVISDVAETAQRELGLTVEQDSD